MRNTFFSNIVLNLNVAAYHEYEGICRNISDLLLKAIVKYRNHSSIKAINKLSNSNDTVAREKILKEISGLDHTEPYQE